MTETIKKQVVLIVDDNLLNTLLVSKLLQHDYQIIIAYNGVEALELVHTLPIPDLILLDIEMPVMDGYQVCSHLKKECDTADIPVIFLTGKSGTKAEKKALEYGAVDYITKPINPTILQLRIKTQLQLKASTEHLKQQKEQLEQQNKTLEVKVTDRNKELQQTKDITILAMTTLAEMRNNETGNHIRRTQHYVKILAEQMSTVEKYRKTITNDYIDLVFKSAPLHDIGKVGIPDAILLKPGKLDEQEFKIMKKHAQMGADAILEADKSFSNNEISFLTIALKIAQSHHEKWDGTGYPNQLKGEDIPFCARLMAIADVYDALISKRIYKPAFSHNKAVEIILGGKGSHFDPEIVDIFEQNHYLFHSLARIFSDD